MHAQSFAVLLNSEEGVPLLGSSTWLCCSAPRPDINSSERVVLLVVAGTIYESVPLSSHHEHVVELLLAAPTSMRRRFLLSIMVIPIQIWQPIWHQRVTSITSPIFVNHHWPEYQPSIKLQLLFDRVHTATPVMCCWCLTPPTLLLPFLGVNPTHKIWRPRLFLTNRGF